MEETVLRVFYPFHWKSNMITNWKVIEDMSPIERAKAIYHEVNIEEMIKYLHLPPEQAISSLSDYGEIVEATGGKLNDDTGITRNNFFLGEEWVKIRNSFYQSKEWRAFRQEIIKERGNKCEKCKKQVTSFIIHHNRNIGFVVVEEGFLNELKHMDRFTVECRECHEDEHSAYIKAMDVGNDMEKRETGYYHQQKGMVDSDTGKPITTPEEWLKADSVDMGRDVNRVFNVEERMKVYRKETHKEALIIAEKAEKQVVKNLKRKQKKMDNCYELQNSLMVKISVLKAKERTNKNKERAEKIRKQIRLKRRKK